MTEKKRTFAFSPTDSDRLADFIRAGGTFCAQDLPSSALAYVAWAFRQTFQRPSLWITDGPKTLDVFYQDVQTLGSQQTSSCFPTQETLESTTDRLKTLNAPSTLVVTCIQALLQKTIAPAALRAQSPVIQKDTTLEMETLLDLLNRGGYDFQPEVLTKGQASLRGGIVDVWPLLHPTPIRIEFFGSTIESLRTFNAADQKSIESIDAFSLAPAREEDSQLTHTLLDYLPPDTVIFWIDPDAIEKHATIFEDAARESNKTATLWSFADLQKIPFTHQIHFGIADGTTFELQPLDGVPTITGSSLHPDLMDKARGQFVDRLNAWLDQKGTLDFYFSTEGGQERFLEMYGTLFKHGAKAHLGSLSEGFVYEPIKKMVVAESDFYGRRKEVRTRYDKAAQATTAERITEWTDIQPGDFVVHFDHGIGKYLGLYEIEFNGQQQEVLAIEYAEKAKLYLPVSQTHLLSRYVGVGKRRPELHTLGGKRWQKEKVAAQKSVQDLAAALLQTQAVRDAMEGHAFSRDVPWQHEFETAFPFTETPDQLKAINDVKKDMENKRPMDRLVCGDVGYGKTEVAMRAAFKAVMDNKQVAVLVPTTILAQQHYDTFATRMAAYPVRIEMLSRFQTKSQQKQTVQRLAEGVVDIVIGTHRLVQPDVQFKDLGLVIIDEEQRFGVTHKEHLKHMRRLVDILTLTATPIPRTLYMSLTGAKDLSTIQTPPVERLPIETIVAQNTDAVVREAVLRELNREGQVYYLHNRVKTIHHIKENLQKLVPEARIEIAHGQMDEKELATIMRAFVNGNFDVLLCTTIIESGLDIPNVNTIIIDRADRFGMADLYQLRGRVGRYKRKAYAYLLLPRHGQLFDMARKRIGAIRRYSNLGSGFKLALRDLEIRGAGNILGAEQSGHIAAIGFDLYCQLLKRTVAQLKGDKVPPIIDVLLKLDFIDLSPSDWSSEQSAVIPPLYVEDENQRLSVYRKLAGCSTAKEVDALRTEIQDRFGKLPAATERLFKLTHLRIEAQRHKIKQIETTDDKVVLHRRHDYVMADGRHPRLKAKTPDTKLDELLQLVKTVR